MRAALIWLLNWLAIVAALALGTLLFYGASIWWAA
jgi:hypothetical protein